MSISVGIVGLGMFGPSFISHYKKHPDVHRLALCDMKSDRLAEMSKRFEISETYSSLDEICKTDIDALVIITQPWLHVRQAVQAMNAGKHVYTAVPAAQSLDECDELIETVKKTGMTYMNGETSYFYPETAFCRKKASEGAFGHIVYCEGEYFHDMSHGLYDVSKGRWGDQWGWDKTGDSPMYYPSHSLCFPISVTGGAYMTEVSAQGFIYPNDEWYRKDTIWKNEFSNEVALFKMSNGTIARICEFRRVGHPGCVRSCIYGTDGSFENNLAGAVWADKHGSQVVPLPMDHEWLPEPLASDLGGHAGSHAYLVHEFVDSVNRERLPRINVWEAVRYCAPGFVAHESAMRDGELLKIPDWGNPPA